MGSPGTGTHTSHPVSLAVRETIVEPAQDTKRDDGGNIDQIWKKM